jgi:hypothetical protein
LIRCLTRQIAIHVGRDILFTVSGAGISCSSDWQLPERKLPWQKSKKGLDNRHRDKTGRIERKHGNTKVAALRKEYGPGFAKGRRKDMMLTTLLKETGSNSLHDYLRHHHR